MVTGYFSLMLASLNNIPRAHLADGTVRRQYDGRARARESVVGVFIFLRMFSVVTGFTSSDVCVQVNKFTLFN